MDDLNAKAARNRKIRHAVAIVVLVALFLLFIFPFILVLINVFKTKADINSNPLALVGEHGFTLKNFPEAMKKMNFWRSFGNSMLITVSSTILTILLASMTSYVIVRNKWKVCGALFGLMIASMVIPFQADDSSGISVRRCAGGAESPHDLDLYACGFLPVHGYVYVPWGHTYQCAHSAGGGGYH